MNKKIILTLIAGSLLLSACGKEETTKETTKKENLSHEQIVSSPLELTVGAHFRNLYGYNDDWLVEKEAAKLTNISLKPVTTKSSANSKEIFNLIMVSGNLPDIVGGYRLKEEFNMYGAEGAFIPLNDLIEEHAPNIKKLFEEKPEIVTNISAPDGSIYFLPYVPDGNVARGYFIRKDWLKKVGMDTPENIDELYKVLKAFRNMDPNESGRVDTIAYFNRHWEEVIRLANFWGARVHGSDLYKDFYVEDGKIRHGYINPEFRVGISNVAKWYEEGLIDQEIFTRGSRSREELLSNNLGGFTNDWIGSTAGYTEVLKDSIEGFDFGYIAPPADINGDKWVEHGRKSVQPDGWAISHNNATPVETIKYFDFFYGETGRRLANFGVEGVHYDMVEGTPIFKEEVLNADKSVVQQLWEAGAQIPRGFHQDINYEKQWMSQEALEAIEAYEENGYVIEQFPGVVLTNEEKAVFDRRWNIISTYMDEKTQNWIIGTEDVNKDWDNYLETLDSMGMSEVIEIMQTAYDRN